MLLVKHIIFPYHILCESMTKIKFMIIFSYGSSLGDLDPISYIRPTDILRQMGGGKMEKELKNRYSATRNTLGYKSFGGGRVEWGGESK